MSARPLTLQLDFFHPWSNQAGVYVARADGLYADAGLDLALELFALGTGDPLDRVERGEADLAISYPSRLEGRRQVGVDVVSVAALNQRALGALVTIAATGIGRPRDLVGRRVATPLSSRLELTLRHAVARDGGDGQGVEVIGLPGEEPAPDAIAARAFDATFGTFWAWEAFLGPGLEVRVWPEDEIGIPAHHAQLLVARRALIEEHADLVRAFLAATAEGARRAAHDPPRAAALLAAAWPGFGVELYEASLRALVPTWGRDEAWGRHHDDLLAPYLELLHDLGLLGPVEVGGSYTNDLLPGA